MLVLDALLSGLTGVEDVLSDACVPLMAALLPALGAVIVQMAQAVHNKTSVTLRACLPALRVHVRPLALLSVLWFGAGFLFSWWLGTVVGALALTAVAVYVFALVMLLALVTGEFQQYLASLALVMGSTAALLAFMMAMWMAPALVVLGHMDAQSALKQSFVAVYRNLRAVAVYEISLGLLMGVAVIPLGLGLVVALPVILASYAAAFRDIFQSAPDSPLNVRIQ